MPQIIPDLAKCEPCKHCKETCTQYYTFEVEKCKHWLCRNIVNFKAIKDLNDLT